MSTISLGLEAQVKASTQRELMERWFPSTLPTAKAARDDAMFNALFAFCREALRTFDEKRQGDGPLPIPFDELLHLPVFLRAFITEPWLAVPKSRQHLLSWCVYGGILWWLMYWPNQDWALVQQRYEDGKEHIEKRIKDSYWANLPKWLTDLYTLAPIKAKFELTHYRGRPWNSSLTPFPIGANKLRSGAHTGIFIDEAAHQNLSTFWRGAMPTIEGRGEKVGRLLLVSSAEPASDFQQVCGAQLHEAVMMARGIPMAPDANEIGGWNTAA